MYNLDLGLRLKELRNRKGLSQEVLAEEAQLSLRTIQRIENNETVPRGDTLKRLAVALGTSPDEIVDWKMHEDRNYLTLMNISALGFLLFPILGIIIPLAMWMFKKDKLKNVNELGKSILNFQISWTLLLFLYYILVFVTMFGGVFGISMSVGPFGILSIFIFPLFLYLYNIFIIVFNAVRVYKKKSFRYRPALQILR